MVDSYDESIKDVEKPYRPAVRYTYIGMGIWVKDHAFAKTGAAA